MNRAYEASERQPHLNDKARIAANAVVIGEVTLGENTTVLFNATLRGDSGGNIIVGSCSNIQENACLHVNPHGTTIVGDNVTVGHGAILHGCTVEDEALIGMGAIVLDGAIVRRHCLVGAGALVTGGFECDEGMLILGSPAKATRALTEKEIASLSDSACEYVQIGEELQAKGLLLSGSSYTSDSCAS